MLIKRMKLDKLHEAAYNPRVALKPGDPEFERLKNSIETFGNVEPIIWNKRTGNVVGGHQRLAVLKAMGETETDVSVVDLKDEDEKLLNVALNKIKGEWDYDLLPELLASFSPEDVKLSGFSAQEIAILCADVNAASSAVIESVAPVGDYEGEDEAETGGESGEEFGGEAPENEQEGGDFSAGEEVPTHGGVSHVSVDFEGASWVVALIFPDAVSATDWLTTHGYQAPRVGTSSTIVRVE